MLTFPFRLQSKKINRRISFEKECFPSIPREIKDNNVEHRSVQHLLLTRQVYNSSIQSDCLSQIQMIGSLFNIGNIPYEEFNPQVAALHYHS